MALFVIGDALGDQGQVSAFLNSRSLETVEQTVSLVRVEDRQGDGFAIGGTGFAFAGEIPIAGDVTSLQIYSSTDAPLITVTGLSGTLFEFYQVYSFAGLETAYMLLTEGDDSFVGSGNGDILISGRGNDTIRGNGGDDVLLGSVGRDVLTGGKGADRFVFAKGDGKDKITDFADAGAANDDQIILSVRQFNAMVVTETAAGVELSFNARDVLTVQGWTAAAVGADDFVLV